MKKLLLIISTIQFTTFASMADDGHQNLEEAPDAIVNETPKEAQAAPATKASNEELSMAGIKIAELVSKKPEVLEIKNEQLGGLFEKVLDYKEQPSLTISTGSSIGAMAGAAHVASIGVGPGLGKSYAGSAVILPAVLLGGAAGYYQHYAPGKEISKQLDALQPTETENEVRRFFLLWGPSANMKIERREELTQKITSRLLLLKDKTIIPGDLEEIFSKALSTEEKEKILKAQEKISAAMWRAQNN